MLIILVILEISIGIAAYGKRDEVNSLINEKVDELVKDSWFSGFNNATGVPTYAYQIDVIESNLQCCGYNSTLIGSVPPNCIDIHPTWTKGCKEALDNLYQKNLGTIGGAAISIGVIEIVGLIFAIVIFDSKTSICSERLLQKKAPKVHF